MRILLDENLDVKLRFRLQSKHEGVTVREMGWLGKKNGELRTLLLAEGFGALLTADKQLVHQQNWREYPMRVFVLNCRFSRYESHRPLIATLKRVLTADLPIGVYLLTPGAAPDLPDSCIRWEAPTAPLAP